MVKKFKDFYTQKKVNTVPDETEESQEELNSRLNRSIIMNNSWEFNDSIKKGADINNISVGGINKDNIDYYVSPLTLCIMFDRIDFVKKLIDLDVILINVVSDSDIYDYIVQLLSLPDRKKVITHILKKHPDFIKDVEIRKNTKKFNI